MSSFGRFLGAALIGALMVGFFVWVLMQMAWASNGGFRLEKLAIGLVLATVGSGLVYLMTKPLGRRRRR